MKSAEEMARISNKVKETRQTVFENAFNYVWAYQEEKLEQELNASASEGKNCAVINTDVFYTEMIRCYNGLFTREEMCELIVKKLSAFGYKITVIPSGHRLVIIW